jgi:hypothetical protein
VADRLLKNIWSEKIPINGTDLKKLLGCVNFTLKKKTS